MHFAGNNWGSCDDGTSGMGCGPQETFRSCADIRIEPHPLLFKVFLITLFIISDGRIQEADISASH